MKLNTFGSGDLAHCICLPRFRRGTRGETHAKKQLTLAGYAEPAY